MFYIDSNSSYFFKRLTLLITSYLYERYCFGSIFFQKSKDSIQGVRYYWKVICYCRNFQKQPSIGVNVYVFHFSMFSFRDRMYYKDFGVSRSLFVRASITNYSCCNKRVEKQPNERENRQQVSRDSNSTLLFWCVAFANQNSKTILSRYSHFQSQP